jgi:6-pyruvoyl-tetrahydropterin synthase
LLPNSKPDVFETDVVGLKKKKVTFYTDLDSISFDVERGKTYDFNIIRNKKDTCWVQINTKQNFYFNQDYVQKNKGKYSIEVPEVQELVHIIIALTPTGIKDYNMVNHYGDYYQKVINHFEKFKNEAIIQIIEEALLKNYYAYIKMDACCFIFNENKIEKDGVYQVTSWNSKNTLDNVINEIENFAKLTNFRAFYTENKPYYQSLIQKMDKQTPIKKQWKWLENRFSNRYDHYRVTFSPLCYGSHSTNRFVQDDFKQTMMFVSGPNERTDLPKKIIEGNMTRMIFTEIDHNYVNPVSDKFYNEINLSIKNIVDWSQKEEAKNYPNKYAVFNEYMTWGVFMLYALENFSKEDSEILIQNHSDFIVNSRGFIKFKEFNKMLTALYRSKGKNKNIENLYPEVLKWCSEQ